MNFLSDWLLISFLTKKKENNKFSCQRSMDHRVKIINVASTQIKIFSLDGPSRNGGFKLNKHGRALVGQSV